jgi:hypothetical protein
MPAIDKLTAIIKRIPDGAQWLDGGMFKEALQAILDDRARADGQTIYELPGAGGRYFKGTAAGGAAAQKTPWEIIRGPVNGEGVPLIGVNYLSSILNPSLDPTDNLIVTGLLTSISPTPEDPGWFAVPAIGGKIWLQIGTADPGDDTHALAPFAGTTQIQHADDVTTIWDEYPAISINTDDPSNPYQEFFNLLIAEVTDPEGDDRPALMTLTVGAEKRQITQMYNRQVLLTTWAVDGLAMIVPVDPALLWLATA